MTLARLTEDELTKKSLKDLATNVSKPRLSVLDILDMYPNLPCTFGIFLSLLPLMRVRQYSISSSPLASPYLASVTYNVIDEPIPSVPGSKRFLGVATNYLKALQPREKAQIAIKKSHHSFHLPEENSRRVIMICAGTGIAPFRGFVEERAVKIGAGQKLAPAVLFVGCKNKDHDRLYAEQFEKWEKLGVVEMFYAFFFKSLNPARAVSISRSELPQRKGGFLTCSPKTRKSSFVVPMPWVLESRMS